MKRYLLLIILICSCNFLFSQSKLGLFGKLVGEVLEGTSKKNEWQVIGKAIQNVSDKQLEFDKERLKNERTVNYNVNRANTVPTTSNSTSTTTSYTTATTTSTATVPENVLLVDGKYSPADGYVWVDPTNKTDLSVKVRDYTIDERVEELNNKADAARDRGEYDICVVLASRSITLKPNEDAYFSRILANFHLLKFEQCSNDLDVIIDFFDGDHTNTKFMMFFSMQGSVNTNLGNFKKALENCNRALKIEYQEVLGDVYYEMVGEIYANRATANYGLNDYDSAIEDCDQALVLYPESISIVANTQGLIALVKEDYNKALNWFTSGISEIEGKDVDFGYMKPVYLTNRSLANYYLGNQTEALVDANKALKFNASYPNAYLVRGYVKIKMGFSDSGCKDFQKALDLGFTYASDAIKENCNK